MSGAKETLLTIRNGRPQPAMFRIRFKEDGESRVFFSPFFRLRPFQEVTASVSGLTAPSGVGQRDGTMVLLHSAGARGFAVRVEELDLETGARRVTWESGSERAISSNDPSPTCEGQDCWDPPPNYDPDYRYTWTARDANANGVPDPGANSEVQIYDNLGNITDSAVRSYNLAAATADELAALISTTGFCGGWVPWSPNCQERVCYEEVYSEGQLIDTWRYTQRICRDTVYYPDRPDDPFESPTAFYNHCYNHALGHFQGAAAPAVARRAEEVEDRAILLGVGLILTAHVRPILITVGLSGYLIVGQNVAAIQLINALAQMRVDDVFNECYGIGCNFIQAEEKCWDLTGELFGPGGQSSVSRVPQNQIGDRLQAQGINPTFTRARCN